MINYFSRYFFIFIYLLFIHVFPIIKSKDIKFVLNIDGNTDTLNFYYITLFLGEKKENQTYILDTTSSVTTSPCNLCSSCGDHANEYFQIDSNASIIKYESYQCNSLPNIIYNSLSFNNKNNDNCNFILDLIDGTKINGFYTNKLISFEPITLRKDNEEDEMEYIPKENQYKLPIGCSLKETGELQTAIADGVMGLNNNDKSFVSIMYQMNLIKENLFTLCFSVDGGYFALGEIDTKYHINKNISYVDLFSKNEKSELYELEAKKIFVGLTEIENKYISIIDSSSTISYVPKDIFNMMMKGIFYECLDKQGKCGNLERIEGYGLCAKFVDSNEMNDAINNFWPIFKIEFNEYEFIWEPKNYYINFALSSPYMACFGFETEENNKDTIILGTNFMHGYDIIFDRERGRIGFAEAECGRKMSKKLEIVYNKMNIKEEKKIVEDKILKNEDIQNLEQELKALKNRKEIEDPNTEKEKKKINKKYNEEIDNNNINNIYIILFIVVLIFIFITLYNYITSKKNEDKNNKYESTFIDDKIEEKDINNIKTAGQIIEMVNENTE